MEIVHSEKMNNITQASHILHIIMPPLILHHILRECSKEKKGK